jgi:hypothetical protein
MVQFHNGLETRPQQMRQLVKESVKRVNRPAARQSAVKVRHLDHKEDTQGIVAAKEVIFHLLQQKVKGSAKQGREAVALEELATKDVFVGHGIDQVSKQRSKESFIRVPAIFSQGHVRHNGMLVVVLVQTLKGSISQAKYIHALLGPGCQRVAQQSVLNGNHILPRRSQLGGVELEQLGLIGPEELHQGFAHGLNVDIKHFVGNLRTGIFEEILQGRVPQQTVDLNHPHVGLGSTKEGHLSKKILSGAGHSCGYI